MSTAPHISGISESMVEVPASFWTTRKKVIASALGGLGTLVTGVFLGATLSRSPSQPENPAGINTPATAPLKPGSEKKAPAMETTTTTINNSVEQVTITPPGPEAPIAPPVYLSIDQLIQTTKPTPIEELVVSHASPTTREDIMEIATNWAYNKALYTNLGYGWDTDVETLYHNPDSPKWEGFIEKLKQNSDDVGVLRLYNQHPEFWISSRVGKIDSYEILSDTAFTFIGSIVNESTTGDRVETYGEYSFGFYTFEIEGKQYSGWQNTKDLP